MAKFRITFVELDDDPFFDFGACVVVWLILAGCAFGAYAAMVL